MDQLLPQRYFIQLAYKGTCYHGWQLQNNACSVQQTLETALTRILQAPVATVGSSRTDTGVHAEEQFAHLDLPNHVNVQKLAYQLNALLPHDIRVKAFYPVSSSAHARFDAIERTYEYRILREPNPFYYELGYYIKQPLAGECMNRAANILLGAQDFKSFSKVHTDVTHYRCEIREAVWYEAGRWLIFRIRANRFLRGMVRTIVGSLLPVGLGQTPPEYIKDILTSTDRKAAGAAAPAKGLFLTKVVYPPSHCIG